MALADREVKCSAGAGHCVDFLGSSTHDMTQQKWMWNKQREIKLCWRSDGSLVGLVDNSKESPGEVGLCPG